MLGHEILNLLAVPHSKGGDGWLSLPCLFSKHNHKGGADHHPSAKLSPDGNGYRCFACNTAYKTANTMLWDMFNLNTAAGVSNERVTAALAYCSENKAPPKFTLEGEAQEPECLKAQPFVQFPKEYLAKFPSVLLKASSGGYAFYDAIKFLANRRVPLQVIQDLDLRWDAKFKRVVFPTYLKGKVCAGLEGRFINFNPEIIGEDTATKYWVYTHSLKKGDTPRSNSSTVWFRQSQLRASKPLVLAEGAFDAARVYQHYRNVTAMSGAFVGTPKLEYLKQFRKIILLPDNDESGAQSAIKLKKLLPSIRIVNIPENFKDAGEMPSAGVRALLAPHLKLDDPLLTKNEVSMKQTSKSVLPCGLIQGHASVCSINTIPLNVTEGVRS